MGRPVRWQRSASDSAADPLCRRAHVQTCEVGKGLRARVKARTGINEPVPAKLAAPAHVVPLLPEIAEDLASRALLRARGVTPHASGARGIQRLVRVSLGVVVGVVGVVGVVVAGVVVVPWERVGRRRHGDRVDGVARGRVSFFAAPYRGCAAAADARRVGFR